MSNKLEELMSTAKLNDLLRRRDPMEKKKSKLTCVLAIVGAITLIAAIAYAVYRYMNPEYLDDFDDEFDDYEEADDEFEEILSDNDTTASDDAPTVNDDEEELSEE